MREDLGAVGVEQHEVAFRLALGRGDDVADSRAHRLHRVVHFKLSFDHQVVEIFLGVMRVLAEQRTSRHQLSELVDESSPDLDHGRPINRHVPVAQVCRLVSQAGHLKQLHRQLRVLTIVHVRQALLVDGDGHLPRVAVEDRDFADLVVRGLLANVAVQVAFKVLIPILMLLFINPGAVARLQISHDLVHLTVRLGRRF